MLYNKKNKLLAFVVIVLLVTAQPAFAMHIMEGFLPMQWCGIWYAIALPFVILSYRFLRKRVEQNPKLKVLIALSAAFVFILSALKLPSVTGSSSHLTGTTLGTVLVGPWAMPLIGVIVLLFQALLLAHGGISTLGANVFSLSVAGPFVAFGLLKLLPRLRCPEILTLFLATFCGTMATYIATSFQLAIVFPDPSVGIWGAAIKFLSVFAITQVPLALLEGVITVLVVKVLKAQGVGLKLFTLQKEMQK